MTYLETAAQFYREVAETPQVGLCCVQSTPLQLPGLKIPLAMQEMNYGWWHHRSLHRTRKSAYCALCRRWWGLEALQFAYFSRYAGAVIAVEPVGRCGKQPHAI